VKHVSISEDGRHFISQSDDGRYKIFSLEPRSEINLWDHNEKVLLVNFIGDGKIVSQWDDGTVGTWSLESGSLIHKWRASESEYVN
jgi:WD40 repeat protein